MIADIPLLPILAKLAEGLLATLALSLLAFVLGGATGLLVLFARVGRSLNLRRLAKAVQRESVEGLLVRVSSLDLDPGRAFALQAEFIDEMVNSLSAEHRRRIFGSTPAV